MRVPDLWNGQRKIRAESILYWQMECAAFSFNISQSERLFAFSASVLSLGCVCVGGGGGAWEGSGGKFSGRVVTRSGKHGHVVLFVCLLVRQEDTSVVIHTSVYYLFDITVHLSTVPCKTTLCRMLGLTGLVAFAEIHFTGKRFLEMLATLKLTGESSYVATNELANAS